MPSAAKWKQCVASFDILVSLQVLTLRVTRHYRYRYVTAFNFLKSFPPHWSDFISFFTLQLQLQIAILRLPMLVVVFFLA
jgi:hypothetical protein